MMLPWLVSHKGCQLPLPDFSTEALIAERVEGETYASSHYARIAKALAEASEAWRAVANASAFDEKQVQLLKAKAMKATAYASTISGKL
jgi:predicted fused transcriptional regulator/phosphomethylpyrimidine kinase